MDLVTIGIVLMAFGAGLGVGIVRITGMKGRLIGFVMAIAGFVMVVTEVSL